MSITKEQLNNMIKEELQLLKEMRRPELPDAPNLEALQKGMDMINDGQALLMKKAKELKLDFDPKNELTANFNLARIAFINAIFKANYQRSGGRLDE